jgi:hypothetical protein
VKVRNNPYQKVSVVSKKREKGGRNQVSGWVTLAEKARRIPLHPPFLEASAETYI